MFVLKLSFYKDEILEDVLKDMESYLKSVLEQYIDLFAYEFLQTKKEYELCFFTVTAITLTIIEFIKNKLMVSGLIGKIEVYENKLVYGGRIYGKRN